MRVAAMRPALLRFLNPVLAKQAMAGGKRRFDAVIWLALADRHQRRHGRGTAVAGLGDPASHRCEIFCQCSGRVGALGGGMAGGHLCRLSM